MRGLHLPWPPAKLSPNGSHGSYHAHASAARKYRGDCIILLKSQNVPRLYVDPPVMLELTFCPPTKRLSDLDNLLARTKQGIDALAETMGVDDQCFEYTLRRGDPVKGGKVLVAIADTQPKAGDALAAPLVSGGGARSAIAQKADLPTSPYRRNAR